MRGGFLEPNPDHREKWQRWICHYWCHQLLLPHHRVGAHLFNFCELPICFPSCETHLRTLILPVNICWVILWVRHCASLRGHTTDLFPSFVNFHSLHVKLCSWKCFSNPNTAYSYNNCKGRIELKIWKRCFWCQFCPKVTRTEASHLALTSLVCAVKCEEF